MALRIHALAHHKQCRPYSTPGVEIVLKLKTSISDIDLTYIATAIKVCLPVKHGMVHRQTQSQCCGKK